MLICQDGNNKVLQTGGLNNRFYFLTALEARCPKSQGWQGGSSVGCKGRTAPGLSRWPVDGCLCPVSSHWLPSLCVCVRISSVRVSVILDEGPPSWPHFNLIAFGQTLSPNIDTFWDYWELVLKFTNFGGDIIKPRREAMCKVRESLDSPLSLVCIDYDMS